MNTERNILKESLWTTAGAAVILLLAVAAHAGGYLHWESSAFILNYTADRPFLAIIFDPLRNDWGYYQCRELSYVLDYIDAHIVYLFLKNQLCWFISPVSIVLMVFCIWLQQYAGRRLFPQLSGLFFTLHASAMALLPFFTENIFYRTSKILTAASLGVLVFGTALHCLKKTGFWGDIRTLAAAAFIAVFADRQGMFFVTAFAGILAVEQLLNPARSRKNILRIAIGAVFTGIIANVWIVPEIIKSCTGYWPDLAYQTDFKLNASLLTGGFKFTAANAGHALSGIGFLPAAVVGGCLAAGAVFVLLRKHRHFSCFLPFAAVGAVIVCSGVMALRHPAVLEEGIIFSGYFAPAMMIFSFFYLAALAALPEKFIRWSLLLPILAICLRLYPYLYPEMLFRDDKYQKVYQDATGKLKEVIQDPTRDHRTLTLPYRMELLLEKLNGQ